MQDVLTNCDTLTVFQGVQSAQRQQDHERQRKMFDKVRTKYVSLKPGVGVIRFSEKCSG